MNKKIFTVENLLEVLPVSRATLDRWIREAREGQSDFPIPFSLPGRRMLWDAHVVEQWIENRHKATSPNVPAKSEKQKAREFIERQQRAKATLARHGIDRKTQGEA